jgi:hypothetical protein
MVAYDANTRTGAADRVLVTCLPKSRDPVMRPKAESGVLVLGEHFADVVVQTTDVEFFPAGFHASVAVEVLSAGSGVAVNTMIVPWSRVQQSEMGSSDRRFASAAAGRCTGTGTPNLRRRSVGLAGAGHVDVEPIGAGLPPRLVSRPVRANDQLGGAGDRGLHQVDRLDVQRSRMKPQDASSPAWSSGSTRSVVTQLIWWIYPGLAAETLSGWVARTSSGSRVDLGLPIPMPGELRRTRHRAESII